MSEPNIILTVYTEEFFSTDVYRFIQDDENAFSFAEPTESSVGRDDLVQLAHERVGALLEGNRFEL